jgi:autotransporter-associated beta strand protein
MKNSALFTMIGKHFGFSRNRKHHVFFAAGGLFVLGVEILPAEIVFSGDKNIAIPSNFDGVYINVVNGLTGSSDLADWDINPFFGGLFIANSPRFQPVRAGEGQEDPLIRLAGATSVGGALTYSSDWGGSGAEGGVGHLGAETLQFAEGQPGYLGFKIVSENAASSYGWMRVTLSENGANGVIHSWAYENSGGSILTGATGEANQRVVTGIQAPISASTAGDSIILAAGGEITFDDGAQQGDFSGNLEGGGMIRIAGAGGLRLSGTNSFSGTASVSEGSKVIVTSKDNLGNADVKLSAASALVFESLSSNDGEGNTFSNSITIDSGTATLRNSGNGIVEVTGSISGSGGIIKDGEGEMEISGINSYSGTTTVNAGKLAINGNISTSMLTTVNTGASIGGSGIVGALTVSDGATLSPGNSPGNLTVSGDFTVAGNYSWELASLSTADPGTNYDTITVPVGDALILSGAMMVLNLGDHAPSNNEFWQTEQVWEGIINHTGMGSLIGNFEPIDNSAWSTLGSFATMLAGNDINLVWSVVPEPSAVIVASLGVIGLLVRRTRNPRTLRRIQSLE